MFKSTEVRWFSKEPYPTIAEWFGNRGLRLDETASRTDFYQVLSTDDIGIKLREGQVESKKRISQIGEHQFSASLKGNLEEWNKWSFRIQAADKESGGIINHAAPGWIGVKKERIGVKATFGDGWDYLAMSEFPANGLQIEYTRITVMEQVLYSFCLEAFGDNQPEIASYPLTNMLGNYELKAADSYSYPRLLRAFL